MRLSGASRLLGRRRRRFSRNFARYPTVEWRNMAGMPAAATDERWEFAGLWLHRADGQGGRHRCRNSERRNGHRSESWPFPTSIRADIALGRNILAKFTAFRWPEIGVTGRGPRRYTETRKPLGFAGRFGVFNLCCDHGLIGLLQPLSDPNDVCNTAFLEAWRVGNHIGLCANLRSGSC